MFTFLRITLIFLIPHAFLYEVAAQMVPPDRSHRQIHNDRILVRIGVHQEKAANTALDEFIHTLPISVRETFFPERFQTFGGRRSVHPSEAGKIERLIEQLSRVEIWYFSAPVDIPSLIERLHDFHDQIDYAEAYPVFLPSGESGNRYIPNDSLYQQQDYLRTIQAEEAWDIEKGDSTMIIAISDTGIDWRHPDLEPNIYINPGEDGTDGQGQSKRSNGIDDDNNGKIDDWHGWDYAAGPAGTGQDNDPSKGSSHGTSVAGLIGTATDNRIGLASIGFNCRILPLKIGPDTGGGLTINSDVFYYPLLLGARVFNASWGSFSYSRTFEDLLDLVTVQGMLVVGGAGNHGGSAPFYPASYRSVLGVGVCKATDVISGASAYGPTVDVMTPADGSLTISPGTGYTRWGGVTSAAAPIASGLAGLVSAHFPQYTATQVRERIRVTCDNIDSLNPSKAKYASSGRVNAYRALTDPPLPSLRIDSVVVTDPSGDREHEQGEIIGVTVYVHNYLEQTGQPVTLTLVPTTNANAVNVTKATATINPLGTGEQGNNSADQLSFLVISSNMYDASILFRVDITSGAYEDFGFFTLVVNPSYKTIRSGELVLSLPADGSLGYRDYPDNTQGYGFRFRSNDLIYMGGLMIGSDSSHVVDAVRSGVKGTSDDFLVRDNDFRILEATELRIPGNIAATEASARFDAGRAPVSRRLPVTVSMESFAFENPSLREMIFTRYSVRNDSSGAISNLRIGLFMDFGGVTYRRGTILHDSLRNTGYCTRGGYTLVGTFVLDSLGRDDSRRPNFWAVDNDPSIPGNPWGTYDGFTISEKWQALDSYEGRPSAGDSNPLGENVGYVITSRSFDIPPGGTEDVVFGHFISSSSYASVKSKIDTAIAFWRGTSSVGIEDETSIPVEFSFHSLYPNPVSGSGGGPLRVEFAVASECGLRIVLTNRIGQEVRVLTDDRYQPGRHTISLSPTGIPAGLYFVRMTATTKREGVSRQHPVVILQ